MNAKKVTVTAGRTFNHPYEQFSNFRFEVQVEAELGEGEDPAKAIKEAQAQVEGLAEDHKRNLLKSVEELELMRRASAELKGLQRQLTETQAKLDSIRTQHPELALTLGNGEEAGRD